MTSQPRLKLAEHTPQTAHPHRWRVLAVLLVSLLLVVLDTSILNVALKTLAEPAPVGLGARQSELQWSIDSYTLVFAALLFTTGVLADRCGRKRTLLAGLVVFGGCSLWSAYAHSADELIIARAGLGVGGALVLPATLAIIMAVFPPAERAKAIGVWAGAAGLAVALGPITGGALLERFWWGSVFLINLPIVVIGAVATLFVVPESRDPERTGFDPLGVVLSVAGLTVLVYGVIKGGESDDWADATVWGPMLGGLAVLALFTLWERRSARPALDLALFRNRRFSAAVTVIGLVFFALLGATFFLVFYLQSVRGWTPLKAGCLLLPLAVAQLAFSPPATLAAKRVGVRPVCAGGMLLASLAFLAVATIDEHTEVWVIESILFVMGIGIACVMPPATSAAMSAVARDRAGTGAAVSTTFRQVGGALGVAVLGSVLSVAYRSRVEDHLTPLPAPVRDTARESVAATLTVAEKLGAPGSALAARAVDAFVSAMHLTALVAAGVTVLGALVCLLLLPSRTAAGTPGAEEPTANKEVHTTEV
ncbi:DHA2 family efflux MFS transporter permease subunit [Streptomyces herbicida]|uniref:DHA2 family efflux MFS transporter permease subunit n=1 Tax=Streptomyces herbicida TaxID=3065675 RepID=UPI00293098BA|nr:DHA2 family efflux MFS transporter permease subunit [Streptomyces sp. NEAU-HV9]